MVSYYNPAAMYRHQQQVSNSNFQSSPQMHTWYAAGYHQGAQMAAATAPPSAYCSVQEEQQLQAWHHHTHPGVFPHEFQDYMAMPPQQQQHNTQIEPADNNAPHHQLPSPPITVSGSEMSSPGAGSGHISPSNHTQNQRPPPVRSPYEWIKKTSYQSQPNPGKTRTKDKYRVVYTDHQRLELEREFTFNNKYITIRRKSELAANLGLSERQIKIWFQNRRAKERKQNKKRVEEKHDFNTAVYQQQQQQQTF